MKYKFSGESIPQDCRKEINEKIEYIVNNNIPENKTGISKEDIFNAYTGNGGLHGLEFKNYDNYYTYQRDKAEIEQGQFFTPYRLVEWIYDCLRITENDLVADLTSGHGAFACCIPNEANFYGCEQEIKSYRVSKYLYPEAKLENTDIRFYEPGITFDYVVGNPPYNLRWKKAGTEYHSEMYYCMRAAELMKPAGIMAVIVPQSFLADQFSDGGMIAEINKSFNYICQVALDKDTFRHLGVKNYKTKILFLQKKSEYLEEKPFETRILSNVKSDYIWKEYLEPLTKEKERIKRQLFLEEVRNGKDGKKWCEKVEKLLYDIKRNPKVNRYYADCVEYVNKYHTQKKPEHIKYDEWETIKIKPDDVIKKLKGTLRLQNEQKSQKDRLIKKNYTVKYNDHEISINDMVLDERLSSYFGCKWLNKLVARKKESFELQSQDFSKMKSDPYIKKWLNELEFTDEESTISLNDRQKKDLNLFIQKPYCFIQWEQGCGKTLAGIAIGKYRLQHNHIKNVFIVSTAIAIKNNWKDVLEQYGIDFCMIEKHSDIFNIREGQFVLITLNMVSQHQKFLKKYVKSIGQKAVLVFDESDNISNMDSKRTKAVLDVFRRLKYKTLMTGTSTRNNISEIYPQLELLYNNSINMMSECEYIQERNRDGELEEVLNAYYMKPYPAYRKGFKLFTAGHIPEKITVFGEKQYTQDVFNAKVLKRMLNKTIITRTFEEISGRKLYDIRQITCPMGAEEMKLYDIAIKEFYKLEYLFKSTGNSRKDAMLKLVNQLNALLKICAAPQTLKEYDASIMPEKFKTILAMLKDFGNERVAIGARHISVVKEYENAIKEAFPCRPVFVITGNETSLKQRKKIVAELERTQNGILISTQQSLSASMNIDFVDRCIIPELHWNNSSMSQYYFRFIRYTSERFKQVYFVTYENSIESNLLNMVLRKDKLNLFMKNQDITDDELYDRFGVDSQMLENLLRKVKTQDGYVLRWGELMVS